MKTGAIVLLISGLVWIGCGRGAPRDATVAEAPAESPDPAAPPGTPDGPTSESIALQKADPAGLYGLPMSAPETVAIAALNEDPEQFLDRTFVVEGLVSRVCPRRGCWLDLTDDSGATIRVKVEDGIIVFPLSAKGRNARVEGTLERIELDEEGARNWMQHEAAEVGEEFDPAMVTGPQVIWRVRGRGAEIKS